MNLQVSIRRVLKEYWVKKKQDNTDLENILNKVMPKKYSWWKKITIDELSYSELSNVMTIYGTLEVDKEWGSEKYEEYYNEPFPYNSGTEDDINIRLGNIISNTSEYINKISKLLSDIIMSVTEYGSINRVRINVINLKFI